MAVPLAINSLSALRPVKLVYEFNSTEHLTSNLNSYRNGFSYYKHDALENFQDAVFSNKNCLIVTDNISLKQAFESDSKNVEIGTIAGTFYLQTPNGKTLTTYEEGVYVQGLGENLLLSLVPLGNRMVELKYGKDYYLQVDAAYPYTARVTANTLDKTALRRQQFQYDYKDGKLSFKTLTNEGWRYLSYGADQVVRAIGLMLNETVVNSYLFTPKFVTQGEIYYDFDATSKEIKYFNELTNYDQRETVAIKNYTESNTNLLISCPTSEIAKSTTAKINIASTKSNFSSTGTYNIKQT